jgi:aryl-alcohol dehydrogenase-like predicted oxidoreductase
MDCVLVGARDEKQVRENVMALSFSLSETDMDEIAKAILDFQLAEI